MITFIKEIFEAVLYIPQYILFAIETTWNLLMEGIQLVFELATSLIPLPEVPAAPEFITSINWFFPVGAVVAVLTPIVVGYTAFLLIRWVYAKVGDL